MKQNWQAINDKFKGGFLLVGLVECTTNGFFDEDKIKDINEFFSSHPCPSVHTGIVSMSAAGVITLLASSL